MSTIQRSMGFFSVVAMVLSLQLGSGIFVLPSLLAPYGIWGIGSWLIAGAGAMVLCHVFSALASHHPMVGGPHVYIGQAFGKRWAFYVGWTYWVLGWLASAPLIVLALHSLQNMMGDFGVIGRIFAQCGILWALMLLNIRGSQLSGLGERIFALLKMLPLIVLPLISMPFWQKDILMAPIEASPLESLNGASLLTFWGFVGLEGGTTIADSVKNPKKIIPRALFCGTLIAMAIYMVNTASILSIVPRDILLSASNCYGAMLDRSLGLGWGKIIDTTVFIVCIGSLNSWILAGGQVVATCSKSRLLPDFFGKINGHDSPAVGIKITTGCLLACVMVMQNQTLYDQIQTMIGLSTALYIGIYILSVGALMALIRRDGLGNGWLLRCSIGLSLVFCIWILFSLSTIVLLFSTLIPASGYLLSRIFHWPVR